MLLSCIHILIWQVNHSYRLKFYLVHPQHLKQKLEAHLHQRRLISVVKFSPRAERTASVLHQSPTYRTLILRKILPFLTRKRCLKRSKVPIRNLLKWWTTKNHRSTGVTRTCFSPLLLYINKSKCQNLYPQIVLLWLVSNLQYLKFLTNTWLVHYIFYTFRSVPYIFFIPVYLAIRQTTTIDCSQLNTILMK